MCLTNVVTRPLGNASFRTDLRSSPLATEEECTDVRAEQCRIIGDMTLIVAMANPSYILQVGDRLTSQRLLFATGAVRYRPWEVLANKALVYAASDALVTISYTGVAYMGDKNTDTWLAEQLDSDISEGPRTAFRVGGSERRVSIGTAVKVLAERIEDFFISVPTEDRAGGLTLQIVGWKWRRRNSYEMPIIWHLSHSGGYGASTQIDRSPRYWGWEKGQARFDAIGDRRSNPLNDLTRRVSGATELYADFVEQEMVHTIRAASAVSSGAIGRNCISILMGLSTSDVRVRYFPESSTAANYDVFTPWLIAPGVGASAPSRLTTGLPSIHLGGLEIRFERLSSPSGPFGSGEMSSVPRKPKP